MLHVSSVSKLTIDSPPFAASTLFGGRNLATTVSLSVSCRWSTILMFTFDRRPRTPVSRVSEAQSQFCLCDLRHGGGLVSGCDRSLLCGCVWERNVQ
jgi:hypothetical protein